MPSIAKNLEPNVSSASQSQHPSGSSHDIYQPSTGAAHHLKKQQSIHLPPIDPQPGTSSATHSQNTSINKWRDGGGGGNAAHGLEFRLRMAMLMVLNLLDLKQTDPSFEYHIWLEKAGFGKFNNIVLKYKNINGKWTQICLSCKSGEEKVASDGSKYVNKVTARDLLSVKRNTFSLLDNITSYSQIRDTNEDCDTYFVLITNREYSSDIYDKYSFFQREEIDLTSEQMFSKILVGKAFKIKYKSEFKDHILTSNRRRDLNLDSKAIEEFCDKFLFVCDNRQLDVEVHDKISFRSNGNEEKTMNWIARLRCLMLDMYQHKAEPTHNDFIYLMNYTRVFYKVQPAHPNFTGRLEEIKKISNAMHINQRETIIDLSVTGMSGMGKTQVVRKYIEYNMHKFKHIIWINAENENTLKGSFLDLAQSCQLIKKDGKNKISDVTKAVYDFFSEQTLLVFDNAGEALLLQRNSGEYFYLPNNATYCDSKFIVISQSKEWPTNYEVTLNAFSKEEALLYLDKVIKSTKKEKQDIAERVQYCPLALCLAASYITLQAATENTLGTKSVSQSDVIKNIHIGNENLHTHLHQQQELETNNASLQALWQEIQATLKTNSDSDLSFTILYILSFSNPDNFPIELLKFDRCNDDQVKNAISILGNNSLVTIENNSMTIHRALQAVVRNSVISDPILHENILALGAQIFEKYLTETNEFKCRQTLGNIHMYTFLQHLSESQITIQTYLKMAGHLFKKLVSSYDLMIIGKKGSIFENIILKTIQYYGEKSEETQNLLSTKALMLANMGKYEVALNINNQILQVRTEKLGNNHPSTVTSMLDKASVLAYLEEHDEALKIYNNLIEERTKELGLDHADTLTCMHNKASLLNRMREYNEALKIINQVIELRIRNLGKEHPSTLESLRIKASVLCYLEKYDDALNIYNTVIDVETIVFGKDDPDTLNSLHKKASVLDSMGKHYEALSIYNDVIELQTAKLGEDHPITLNSMMSKGSLYENMGKHIKATVQKKLKTLLSELSQ